MEALKSITPKQKRNIIIALVVIVIIYFVRNQILKTQRTTVKFDKNNIPTMGTGVNGQAIPWNPEPLAKEVFENLEGYNLYIYPETSEKILKLNNDQLTYLYNYYNQYLAAEYSTITQLFESEWNGSIAKYTDVVAKFKSLGLK